MGLASIGLQRQGEPLMSHPMVRVMGCAIALCVCALPALAEGPRKLHCSAKVGRMAHDLTLTVGGDGQVTAFDYSSVDVDTAHDCAARASRTAGKEQLESEWTAPTDGTTKVVLRDPHAAHENAVAGTVTILWRAGWYRLTQAHGEEMDFCAPGAYLAPVVTLTVGKKKCELGEAKD